MLKMFAAVAAVLALTTTANAVPAVFSGTGNTYDFIVFSGTWDAARLDAIARGGHLATILSAEENTFLFNHRGTAHGSTASAWIGLNDLDAEGTFVWVTGE